MALSQRFSTHVSDKFLTSKCTFLHLVALVSFSSYLVKCQSISPVVVTRCHQFLNFPNPRHGHGHGCHGIFGATASEHMDIIGFTVSVLDFGTFLFFAISKLFLDQSLNSKMHFPCLDLLIVTCTWILKIDEELETFYEYSLRKKFQIFFWLAHFLVTKI